MTIAWNMTIDSSTDLAASGFKKMFVDAINGRSYVLKKTSVPSGASVKQMKDWIAANCGSFCLEAEDIPVTYNLNYLNTVCGISGVGVRFKKLQRIGTTINGVTGQSAPNGYPSNFHFKVQTSGAPSYTVFTPVNNDLVWTNATNTVPSVSGWFLKNTPIASRLHINIEASGYSLSATLSETGVIPRGNYASGWYGQSDSIGGPVYIESDPQDSYYNFVDEDGFAVADIFGADLFNPDEVDLVVNGNYIPSCTYSITREYPSCIGISLETNGQKVLRSLVASGLVSYASGIFSINATSIGAALSWQTGASGIKNASIGSYATYSDTDSSIYQWNGNSWDQVSPTPSPSTLPDSEFNIDGGDFNEATDLESYITYSDLRAILDKLCDVFLEGSPAGSGQHIWDGGTATTLSQAVSYYQASTGTYNSSNVTELIWNPGSFATISKDSGEYQVVGYTNQATIYPTTDFAAVSGALAKGYVNAITPASCTSFYNQGVPNITAGISKVVEVSTNGNDEARVKALLNIAARPEEPTSLFTDSSAYDISPVGKGWTIGTTGLEATLAGLDALDIAYQHIIASWYRYLPPGKVSPDPSKDRYYYGAPYP